MNDTLVGTFTVDVAANRINLASHPLVIGDQVRFAIGTEPINILPSPLVEGTYYFVVAKRINDFQISVTQGGAVLVITDAGVGGTNEVWKRGVDPTEPETFPRHMSSTVIHEIENFDFAVLKLLN